MQPHPLLRNPERIANRLSRRALLSVKQVSGGDVQPAVNRSPLTDRRRLGNNPYRHSSIAERLASVPGIHRELRRGDGRADDPPLSDGHGSCRCDAPWATRPSFGLWRMSAG
jgi:hypothetical protein